MIFLKINYIHNNPVVEGLVFRAEDYIYSSAVDYSGEKGMIDNIVMIVVRDTIAHQLGIIQ